MKIFLPFIAILALAACAQRRTVTVDPVPIEPTASTIAKPNGPCRDDENFENGRCAPRIPR